MSPHNNQQTVSAIKNSNNNSSHTVTHISKKYKKTRT